MNEGSMFNPYFLEKDYRCLNCFCEFDSADVCEHYLSHTDMRRWDKNIDVIEFTFSPLCPKCNSRMIEPITHLSAGDGATFDENGLLTSISMSFRSSSTVYYIQDQIVLN